MASFARTKMTFQDDCYPDKPEIPAVNLVGANVPKLYHIVYDAMKNSFNVLDNEIEEEDYTWGKSGDKEKFSVRWYVHKDVDYFTFFYLRVDLKGSGNENTGKASIKIKSIMRTAFPQDTLWQRSLLYEMMRTFWHRTFYHKKRVQYLVDCRNITSHFMKMVVKEFREINEMNAGIANAPRSVNTEANDSVPPGTVIRNKDMDTSNN